MSDGGGGVSNGIRTGAATSYPPPAPFVPPAETSTYIIHTETDSLTDLRLQVSVEPKTPKDPLRPLFFRERELSEEGEIVDSLVNASTAEVPWTIHKPARGWYLRLRSPVLPANTALALRPPPSWQSQSSAAQSRSPLMVSLPTSIDMKWLNRAKETIDETVGSGPAGSCSSSSARNTHSRSQSAAHKKQDEDVAHQNRATSVAPTILTGGAEVNGTQRAGEQSAATGVGTSAAAGASGHTRRRSGGSGSHRIEVRKVSNEPREVGLREEEEEDLPTAAGGSKTGLSLDTRHLDPGPSSSSTNLLTPPTQTGNYALGRDVLAGASPGSAKYSSIDRPYSPTEPSSALDTAPNAPSQQAAAEEASQSSGSTLANGGGQQQRSNSTIKNTNTSTTVKPLFLRHGPPVSSASALASASSTSSSTGQASRPLVCHFVLIDGVDAASYEARAPFLPGSGRRTRLRSGDASPRLNNAGAVPASGGGGGGGSGSGLNAMRRRWTSWAWAKLPSAIRPGSLPLDTNHDFSVHWVNPPRLHSREEGAMESVEVLRFEDGGGGGWGVFSGWNEARKGSVVMQEAAVRGLGLERAFWFGLVLAYLDFLESRDSYHAACEG
ncbi:hypothetical protein OC861_001874 [Tilletia horrida]|nr:hypothetical protein OC861_001874 [Tilletia horrida]